MDETVPFVQCCQHTCQHTYRTVIVYDAFVVLLGGGVHVSEAISYEKQGAYMHRLKSTAPICSL